MYPVRTVAHGLVLVVLDLRINGLDVLLDPIGWLLVVVGLGRLARSVHPGFRGARLSAIVAGLLSVTDVIGPATPAGLSLVYGISFVVTMWLIASTIMQRAREAGDSAVANSFDRLRWLLVTVVIIGVVAAVVVTMAIVLVLLIAALAVQIGFIVRLYLSAKRPCLAVPDADAGRPHYEGW